MASKRHKKPFLPRCGSTGKHSWHSYSAAHRIAMRVDRNSRVYRCDSCGRWHMTAYTREEYSRRTADFAEVPDATP